MMKNEKSVVGFWGNEECEFCSGPIVDKTVTMHRNLNGVYIVFEDVPAGVCHECGTRYYATNILKQIEECIHGKHRADREITVPIYSF